MAHPGCTCLRANTRRQSPPAITPLDLANTLQPPCRGRNPPIEGQPERGRASFWLPPVRQLRSLGRHLHEESAVYNRLPRGDGGIGRRRGLKILRWRHLKDTGNQGPATALVRASPPDSKRKARHQWSLHIGAGSIGATRSRVKMLRTLKNWISRFLYVGGCSVFMSLALTRSARARDRLPSR